MLSFLPLICSIASATKCSSLEIGKVCNKSHKSYKKWLCKKEKDRIFDKYVHLLIFYRTIARVFIICVLTLHKYLTAIIPSLVIVNYLFTLSFFLSIVLNFSTYIHRLITVNNIDYKSWTRKPFRTQILNFSFRTCRVYCSPAVYLQFTFF